MLRGRAGKGAVCHQSHQLTCYLPTVRSVHVTKALRGPATPRLARGCQAPAAARHGMAPGCAPLPRADSGCWNPKLPREATRSLRQAASLSPRPSARLRALGPGQGCPRLWGDRWRGEPRVRLQCRGRSLARRRRRPVGETAPGSGPCCRQPPRSRRPCSARAPLPTNCWTETTTGTGECGPSPETAPSSSPGLATLGSRGVRHPHMPGPQAHAGVLKHGGL